MKAVLLRHSTGSIGGAMRFLMSSSRMLSCTALRFGSSSIQLTNQHMNDVSS